jgi:hypothetical protein
LSTTAASSAAASSTATATSSANAGVSRVTPPRCPDSLCDVTNLNEPSDDGRLPPPWLIVTGIVGALALVLLLGIGFGQEWGAQQWGPVAAWFAGAATLAAVVAALWQARIALRQADIARRESGDLQLARLVDHEVSRRRECIEALANLWASITGMQMEFAAWTGKVQTLPLDSIPEETRRFSWEWQNRIEPPLFVALLVLRGTPLYDAVGEVNDKMNEIKTDGLEPIRQAVKDRQRPDTEGITSMWKNITDRRDAHLTLARQHFSLSRKDVERSVPG